MVNANNTIKHVEYLDGFQYTGRELNFFPHAEGYVNVTLGTTGNRIFNYVYYYTDHLGNIRLSYTKDMVTNQLKIMDENHYYPFGLKHQKYTPPTVLSLKAVSAQKARPGYAISTPFMYKYNGKEFQDELGLGWYDYGARNYDPALGHWMNIDPAAELSRRNSPYVYALNNPVFFIDPDGMFAEGFNMDELSSMGDIGFAGCADCGPNGEGLTPTDGSWVKYGGQSDPPTGSGLSEEDPVQLDEVVIVKKAPASRNPYDNPNVAAAAEGLYAAQLNSPAVQDMEAKIKDALSWVPGGGFQYIPEMGAAYDQGNYVGTGVYAIGMVFGKVGGKRAKLISNSFKGVSKSQLKKWGIKDIHKFKETALGTNKNLSKFDVVKDTSTNELMIIIKETQTIVTGTGKFVK